MRSSACLVLGIAACHWGSLALADEDGPTTTPSNNFLGKGNKVKHVGDAIEKIKKHVGNLTSKFGNKKRLDVAVGGTCAPEIKRLCATVVPGNGKIVHCLRDARKAAVNRKEGEILSEACSQSLASVLLIMSHKKANTSSSEGPIPVDVVPGLRDACNKDAKKGCDLAEGSDKVKGYMACLQKLNYDNNLKPICRKKVTEVQIMYSKNLLLDPQYTKACGPEILKIQECKELPFTPFSGKGEKQKCLKRHISELGDECKKELNRVDVLQSKDVRTNAKVFANCKKELTTFCKDVEFGEARMMKCLWQNIGKNDFSEQCKTNVKGETKNMMSNYTKDYRLRNRCSASIDSLCADAKQKVKGTDVKEFEGAVIQCLKKNYTKIEKTTCKEEVRRVVKIHSRSPEMNPQWLKQCEADKKEFCADSEYVHLCLRKNLEKISEGCRKVEVLQGSLEAKSINMKPKMKEKCQAAIKDFCKDVPEGDAQVIQCLRKHYDDKDFPQACGKVVKKDLVASQHDLKLKYGVAEDCKQDAEEFCPDFIHNGGVDLIACMRSELKSLKVPSCKNGIKKMMQAGNKNIEADIITYTACVDDVSFFCPNVPAGQGKVHQCLVKNKLELSKDCAEAEFKVQEAVASDASLSPMVMKQCQSVIQEHCKSESGSGLWGCLEDAQKKVTVTFPENCRKHVVYHIRMKNSELFLNPTLYKMCNNDFEKLCQDQLWDANDKSFISDGAAIDCLIEKRAKVQDSDCMKSMVKTMQERVNDIKANPQAHGICSNDIRRFCADAPKTPGGVQTCLKKNLQELSDLCQDIIGNVMKMQSEDVRLQPAVQKNCKQEIKNLCADVSAGKGKVKECLLKNLHHNDMQAECKKVLEKDMQTQSTNILLNPVLLSACKGQYEKLRDENKCSSLGLGYKVEDISALNPAEIMKKPELQGHIRQCLLDNRKKLTSFTCKAAVKASMAKQSDDLRANPIAMKACKEDLENLCKDIKPGRGNLLQCLGTKRSKIKNPKCKIMVKDMREAQREDVTINPKVKRLCTAEQKSYCGGIEHGNSRVMKCLANSVNETGFGQDCKDALKSIRAIEVFFKDGVSVKTGFKDIMKWLEKNGTSNKGIVTGAIAGCLVSLSLISACYLAYKKGVFAKNGYAVVPRALDA